MDIKSWFKEDKGGFGAFLIFVIVGLTIYTLQRKDPVINYEPTPTKTEEVTATEPIVAREPYLVPTPVDSAAESSAAESEIESAEIDSALVALSSVEELVRSEVKKASYKPKVKPTRKILSKEEIVLSKLRAGMSVNQIAKVTGYDKKYIRGIKKKKVCNCK